MRRVVYSMVWGMGLMLAAGTPVSAVPAQSPTPTPAPTPAASSASSASTEGGPPPPAAAGGGKDALTQLARRLADPADQDPAEAGNASGANSSAPSPTSPPSSQKTDRSSRSAVETMPLGRPTHSQKKQSRRSNGSAGSGRSWVLQTLTSLGLVIALILLLRWAWSKMSGRVAARPSAAVEVLARTSVAPKNQVLLLRVGGRILVVGDSSAGLRTLTEVQDPEEVADLLQAITASRSTSVSSGFSRMLSRSSEQLNRSGPHRRGVEDVEDEGEHQFDRARDSVSGLLSRIRHLSEGGRGA